MTARGMQNGTKLVKHEIIMMMTKLTRNTPGKIITIGIMNLD